MEQGMTYSFIFPTAPLVSKFVYGTPCSLNRWTNNLICPTILTVTKPTWQQGESDIMWACHFQPKMGDSGQCQLWLRLQTNILTPIAKKWLRLQLQLPKKWSRLQAWLRLQSWNRPSLFPTMFLCNYTKVVWLCKDTCNVWALRERNKDTYTYSENNTGARTPPVIFFTALSFSSDFDRATYELSIHEW